MARRKRRIDPEVYREIHRMVREGTYTSAAAVHKSLVERFHDKAPSVRTVQDIVRELDPLDPSGPWVPGPPNDPEDDVLILETLGEPVRAGLKWEQGGVSRWKMPSKEEARWIVWVRRGWPDLDLLVARTVADEYRARRAAEAATDDLDAFLALAPWRSLEAANLYERAIKEEQVRESPFWWYVAVLVPDGEGGPERE